jgi:small subunit ribosomal protein S15
MTIAAETQAKIIQEYQRHGNDRGSPEVQVAILTQRISGLTDHLRSHRHDFSSRRGLMQMVGRRNRLLRFLSRTDQAAYQALIKRLGLRK